LSLYLAKELPAAQIDRTRLARLLLAVSPRSPLARAASIEHDWDEARIHVSLWRKDASRSPAFLAAMGRHEKSSNELRDAETYLMQYIKISPDAWAYEKLAGIYKSQT